MNNDLISREALRKDIEENAIELGGVLAIEVDCAKALIDNAPTVEAVEFEYHSKLIKQAYQKGKDIKTNGEWIPVSERLPEEETDVLVCNINGDVTVSRGSYSTEMKDEYIWYTIGWRFGKVIAWMPLPEPYKEAENE